MLVDRLLRVALAGSTWVLYLLLALSVVSFAAMLERWVFFRRGRGDVAGLRAKVGVALREGDHAAVGALLQGHRSLEASILARAWPWHRAGAASFSDALDSELAHERRSLERGVNLLGTLGNNAPFVGLFGTVLGVIEAFHELGAAPGGGAMGNVMAGISEALVATGVGLFVALPAVVAYNLIQARIGVVEANVAALGKLIGAGLHGGAPAPAESYRNGAPAPSHGRAAALAVALPE